ncbi:MAG TPA: PstS family phosphate ABC transporter substrate-binding protein [Bdellovibrionales bacterium]|nr:PstS family phosphate ABC transporter substrate-binding protein [Bdellovibrionales bacterium]
MLSLLAFFAISHAQTATIKIDGSSTVYPITEAVAEEFQTSKRGKVKITVGVSGTGGGFKKFCRGETDIQDASRPIQKATKAGETGEMETCAKAGIRFFEIPIAFDATVIIVNKANTFLNQITVAELKKMWEPAAEGKVKTWKDVNPAWPAQPLKLYGAGADSGTFDYFTEAVVGKAKLSRGDYTPSEDDNVLVKGVSSDKNALGYLPFSYYEANKASLKVIPVIGKGGKPIIPARDSVENGTYEPLSRPLFIYVSEKSYARAEIKEFVEFYLTKAPALVVDAKYVPLPEAAYKLGLDHVKAGKLGTVFAGHSEVGMKIEDLMKKEKKLQ